MNDWREVDIEALEERVRIIGELVAMLGVIEAVFENDRDQTGATQMRTAAGFARERAAGYTDRARKLRADQNDQAAPLPVTYFSRKV